jgi:thiol-disulfide isomerase/thioredoxin
MPRPLRAARILLAIVCLLLVSARSLADEPSLYEYVLTDLEGKETTLASYKGRVLVVEFFATWCPPCRKDLPEVAALQPGYSPEKVTFLAVSADGTTDTVRRLPGYVKEADLKIPVLVGGGIFIDRFAGIDKGGARQVVLPQTYVFDGTGELAMRLVGEQKNKKKLVMEELDRLLKGNSS